MNLLTIGYEGRDLEDFFGLLRAGNVDTIVDVRQMPLSRKKGFSKKALEAAAHANGFGYVHLSEFGCPKTIRDDYKRNGDWEQYTTRFLAYLKTQESAVADLAQRALKARCCLLCFEADPAWCHRSYVACRVTEVAEVPLSVIHLGVTAPAMAA